jgi:two-component system chemotaxis response regulator CheY
MPAAAQLRVLIVDDQGSMRALIRSGLRDIGIVDIEECNDGEPAAKWVVAKPVDLVISDFNMPTLDGLGLLRAMRAFPATQKVAFIMLTGRGDKELVQRAATFGANNYLVKPFTLATLREKIEAVFGPLT